MIEAPFRPQPIGRDPSGKRENNAWKDQTGKWDGPSDELTITGRDANGKEFLNQHMIGEGASQSDHRSHLPEDHRPGECDPASLPSMATFDTNEASESRC